MMHTQPKRILQDLFEAALAAALPERCLAGLLPPAPGAGRLFVIACGKGGAAMARFAEDFYRNSAIAAGRYHALAVFPEGYGLALEHTRAVVAGHPLPDARSLEAADAALRLAAQAGPEDLVLVLLSGGASALCAAPAIGLDLAAKQALTRALLASGAAIDEVNCVRKHLSRIKGGRLAVAAAPAPVLCLAISDVPGDQPDAIGSGPTVADATSLAEARSVLARYHIEPAPEIARALADPANEAPKPGDPRLAGSRFMLVATPAEALAAAASRAAELGFTPMVLGDALEGEARELAAWHGELARAAAARGRAVAILSGGEATVSVRGDGRGGPNQEYALALALALDGLPGVYALAADTDGRDGGTGAAADPAGAFIAPDTLARAGAGNLEAAIFLNNNDSSSFFQQLGDLFLCGPTRTNVNDFRAILVLPEQAARLTQE